MGWPYTIQAYGLHGTGRYHYRQVWGGRSLTKALFHMLLAKAQAKRKGWGCVTLECR